METTLKTAILEQIGVSEKEFKKYASDYQNAQNGISGFTYYSDTHKFAIDNQKEIINLLEESADDQGIDVVDMVKSFGVFRNGGMDKEEKKDLYKFLGGNKDLDSYETHSVLNVLAWFAVETLAFEYDN